MSGNKVTKQVSVVRQATPNNNLTLEDTAFFAPDGSPVVPGVRAYTTATAIGTAAKVVSAAAPDAGSLIALTFTNGNSAASPTVNFNGAGAVNVLLGGAAPAGAESTFAAGGVGLFFYDGTSLHQVGVYS